MPLCTEGFAREELATAVELPPGQRLARRLPVMSSGTTPVVPRGAWELVVTTTSGDRRRWDFEALVALPAEDVTADLHCVTGWSTLGTRWRGVSMDVVLEHTDDAVGRFAMARSYGGYCTNIPLADLSDGLAWLVFELEGEPLSVEHGGPVRLLVPHLYLWKSAQWLHELTFMTTDRPGFWESLGYHSRGNPWQEQRCSRD
jgi:DMSO/TMAO reductase YedYZ molybdopterin-dependent catalytic subunit